MTAARRAILVICDGLRHDLVDATSCPAIGAVSLIGRRFQNHRSIFPSVTRPSAASIATGCRPGRHGLLGNAVALPEGEGLVIRDVGKPDFVERLRAATGRTLHVPTLAERLAGAGGVVVFSNVSPGAARFHDPDGFGHVHHRAGSFGPGGEPLAPLDAVPGPAGDRAMAERFCVEVLIPDGPALGVLWLCEPDRTGHHFGIGSPAYRDALAAADRSVGLVVEGVRRRQAAGEDVLLLIGADHGQETIVDTIHLEALLVAAGLKESAGSADVLVAPQGSSGLIYLADPEPERAEAIATWLRTQPWLGQVWVADGLAELHLPTTGHLAVALTMAKSEQPNRFGIPGSTFELGDSSDVDEKAGLATHGGLGVHETNPFLIAVGGGFAPGTTTDESTSVIDLAPTILRHLGQPHVDLDGRPLPRR